MSRDPPTHFKTPQSWDTYLVQKVNTGEELKMDKMLSSSVPGEDA